MTTTARPSRLLALFAATAALLLDTPGPVLALDAKAGSVRIASAFDPQTFDPHALALLYHTRVTHQVYESLVSRDAAYKTEPALALYFRHRPQRP